MEQNKFKNVKQCSVCRSQHISHYLSTKDYFLTKEPFDLMRCMDCGYIFTTPQPGKEEIGKYYNSADYFSHQKKSISLTGLVYRLIRLINIRRKYAFIKKFKNGSAILDYGCGTGHLLKYFKDNSWKISGFEPNSSARKIASELCKTTILDETTLKEVHKENFDVIMLWHVLEHVFDVNDTLKFLIKCLKKDGILVVAVPNIHSPDAVKYGKYWAGLDVPRHLSHFTLQSIEKIFENHSLQLISVSPMKFDAYYVSLLSERYLGKRFPILSSLKHGFASNFEARKSNNYSSLIFVAKQN